MAIHPVQQALNDYNTALLAEKEYIDTYLSPPNTITRRFVSCFISLRPSDATIKEAFEGFSKNQAAALKRYETELKALPIGDQRTLFVQTRIALAFRANSVDGARKKYFSAEAGKASAKAKQAGDAILQAQRAAAAATALIKNEPPKLPPPEKKSIARSVTGTVVGAITGKGTVGFVKNVVLNNKIRVTAGSVLTSAVSNALGCDASSPIPAVANAIYTSAWGLGKISALGIEAAVTTVAFSVQKLRYIVGGLLKGAGFIAEAGGHVASKGTEILLGGPTYLSDGLTGLGNQSSRMLHHLAGDIMSLSGIQAKGALLSDTVNYLVDSPVIHTAAAATLIARPLSNKAYEKGYQKTGHAIRAAGAAVTAIPVYQAIQNGSAQTAWESVTSAFGTSSEPVAQTGFVEGVMNSVKDSWFGSSSKAAAQTTSTWTSVTEGITAGIKSINDFGSKTLGPSLKTAWDATVGPTLEAAQGPVMNGAKEALGPTCTQGIETVASYATPLINTVVNNPLPVAAAVAVAGIIAYKTGALGKLASFAASGVRAAIDHPKLVLLPALAGGVAIASPAVVVGALAGLAYNLGGKTVAAPEAATPAE